MTDYYAIYEKVTGRLHATASVVASPEELAAKGLEAKLIGQDQQPGGKLWNPATRAHDIDAPPQPKSTLETLIEAVEVSTTLSDAKAAAAIAKGEEPSGKAVRFVG